MCKVDIIYLSVRCPWGPVYFSLVTNIQFLICEFTLTFSHQRGIAFLAQCLSNWFLLSPKLGLLVRKVLSWLCLSGSPDTPGGELWFSAPNPFFNMQQKFAAIQLKHFPLPSSSATTVPCMLCKHFQSS